MLKCLSVYVLSAGLRGAVAFALVLMLAGWEETTLKTLVTTTLIIVLFTIVILGGSTLPILKVLPGCILYAVVVWESIHVPLNDLQECLFYACQLHELTMMSL